MPKITKISLNRELKKMGYDLEFWYHRSGGQWVIEGIDHNGKWFTRGVGVFALHQLSFAQWIETALTFYTDHENYG